MMRIRTIAVALVVAGAMAGCSTLGRLTSYGSKAADANFAYDGTGFSASLHPAEDVLLIRPGLAEGIASGAASGATFGIAGRHGGHDRWLAIGNHFLGPIGCEVDQLDPLDQSAGYWEYRWRCPEGVDLRAVMGAQRADLRRGEPLRRAP